MVRLFDRSSTDNRRGAATLPALSLALLLPMALGGCASTIPPVNVTRFYERAVPRAGTVSIVPASPAAGADSLEFRTMANALAAALTRTGFTVRAADAGPGQYEAVVGFDRDTRAPVSAGGSPVSVGVGGATGSYGSGLGLGIGINLSGKPKPIVTTRLHVQLRRSADHHPLWEGRAVMLAKENAPAAQPGIAAGKLADALFKGFPGQSGATITVQ
jgi:hypothetical protein